MSTRRRQQEEEEHSPEPSASADARTVREDRSAGIEIPIVEASPTRIPAPPQSTGKDPVLTEKIMAESLAMLRKMEADNMDDLALSLEDMQYRRPRASNRRTKKKF